jgi:hypothetical protein
MNIAETIKAIAKQGNSNILEVCKVKSIDINLCLCECEPLNGGAVYHARLKAIETTKDKGLLILPALESLVIIAPIGTAHSPTAIVLGYSEVSEVHIQNSKGTNIVVKEKTVFLNGENYNGLVKVKELCDKINKLENAFNALVAKYNTHTHLVNAMPPPTAIPPIPTAPTLTTETTTIVPTQQTELENTTVKHGNK